MNANIKRLGIVSIVPPNVSESTYMHNPIKIDNKIKLDSRNVRDKSIIEISPLDDYKSAELFENKIKKCETPKKMDDWGKLGGIDMNLTKKYGNVGSMSLYNLDSNRNNFTILNNETNNHVSHLNQLEFAEFKVKRRKQSNLEINPPEIKTDNPSRSSVPVEDNSKYITKSFNWIHYLLLNDDLIENNIITDASAFEHWEKVGIKEQRTSIIKTNNMKKYAKLYIKLTY
jgi:hypothetical protein